MDPANLSLKDFPILNGFPGARSNLYFHQLSQPHTFSAASPLSSLPTPSSPMVLVVMEMLTGWTLMCKLNDEREE
ncbi:hypothetical protein NPIL_418851 [Nephila pilipes]|uniref:Uncharacterized protein n=1 Tax=Nephila pilipes TaxID=299642 RepID=A0A8X6IKM2_NEPPI|nr:hypothetical protein NPIL_418851 [Nephila pilipes]